MRLETLASDRLPNFSARLMRRMIREAGLNVKKVFADADVDQDLLTDPMGEISGVEELRVQNAFVEATRGKPGLWLQTGLKYRLLSYGPYGVVALSAETLLDGLKVATEFQALNYSLMRYHVNEDNGALISYDADDSRAPDDMREFMHERALGAVTRFLADMCQQNPLAHIESVLDRPPGWMECDDVLGAPVRFGQRQSRWVFKDGAGDVELPMSNPLMEDTYRRLCADLIGAEEQTDEFVKQIYAVLVRAGRQLPNAASVARELAVSERSLHRRLARHESKFGAILDRVRQQRASFLLENTKMPIARVAECLGFAECASFTRAFKRWTGIPPLTYRKNAASTASRA